MTNTRLTDPEILEFRYPVVLEDFHIRKGSGGKGQWNAGDGIRRIFYSLGVQRIVTGGQSMNPSTAQLLEAVESAPADEVVILPNNKNIVPVARQVDGLTTKDVQVVATTSVIEALAALVAYDPHAQLDDNVKSMNEAAERVAVKKSSAVMTPMEERCSIWQWLSTPPGVTMRPSALTSRRPAPSLAPIVAIRPSMTPMSARATSDAVASVPLRTTRSYSAMIFWCPFSLISRSARLPIRTC